MSICKVCCNEILWIPRPTGGWYPPFDSSPEFDEMEYSVYWSEELNGWSAEPVHKEFEAVLTRHSCPGPAEKEEVEEEEVKPEPRVEVRTVYKEVEVLQVPDHDTLIKFAKRLAQQCPTCMAPVFMWCRGVKTGEDLKALHFNRKL